MGRITTLRSFHTLTGVPSQQKQTGLTTWKLFELWVDAKKPAVATRNRWRGVFRDLDKHFGGRSPNAISTDDAQAWAEQLPSKKRTPTTVNSIWCNAARTVFGWAMKAPGSFQAIPSPECQSLSLARCEPERRMSFFQMKRSAFLQPPAL